MENACVSVGGQAEEAAVRSLQWTDVLGGSFEKR